MNRLIPLLSIVVLTMAGCRANQTQQPLFGANNSYNAGSFTPDTSAFQQSNQQANQMAGQVGSLNTQLRQFDSDNQNLHAQVAALQQRLQNANSYNDQLKQQLGDQMTQLQQARVQLQQTGNQMQVANNNGYQAGNPGFQNAGYQMPGTANTTGQITTIPSGATGNPATQFAGATIRANNSLMGKLQTVQLQGYKAWMDGDVIRIEGPTDRLFVSGTYQINANDAATLTNLANTIRQNFPRQVIGVEAHWDGTPIEPATTSHQQLTATQALAVFDLLVKSGLPHAQVFTMAMGSNRMRYPKGNPANRRIEIVIYPETF